MDRETQKVIEIVKYTFEEDGELKEYRVPVKARETGELHYLVQRMSMVPEGAEVILEMKKRGPKNYIEVLDASGSPIEPSDEEVDDEMEDHTGEGDDPAGEEITDEQAQDALDKM